MNRFPMHRCVSIALLLVVTACSANGGGSVPSPLLPASPAVASAAARRSTDACANGPGYRFEGPCRTFELTPQGGAANVPANRGYGVSYVFPVNEIRENLRLAVGDAVYHQIERGPHERRFPPYRGTGTTLLYAVMYAPHATKVFQLEGKVRLIVTSAGGFPGKHCTIAQLFGPQWQQLPGNVVATRRRLSAVLHAGAMNFTRGKSYTAVACR